MRVFIVLLFLNLIALCMSAACANPILIKFSLVVAENTPKGQAAIRFRDLVNERLKGKVRVEVFPNSQLYNDDTVMLAMLLGDVQMAAPSLSKFNKYTDSLQLFDLPFLFNSIEDVDRFNKTPEGKKLLRSMERRGLIGLGYIHNGMKQLSAHKRLRVPKDAKGLKFRIQASDVLAAQFHQIGAIPIKKPFSEVFTLLQTGAIDGQENTWSNIYSMKFYEAQEYITESNHGYIGYMVIVTAKFWNGLPPDIRAELEKALEEAMDYGSQVALDKAVSDRQRIVDSRRSTVITITREELAQWREAMKPVWKKFEDEIGKDLIEAAARASGV